MEENLRAKIDKSTRIHRAYTVFSILFAVVFCINTYVSIRYPSTWRAKIEKESSANTSIKKNPQLASPESRRQIEFSDSNFEAAVRDLLDKERGPIYNTDLDTIEDLNLSDLDIGGTEDLRYFGSLKTLNLSRNQIKDLTGMENLKNLQVLNLYHNDVSDIEPLGRLGSLKTVDLSHNKITDITPLSKLSDLESADLSFNQITDISPLFGLDSVDELDISNNKITNKDDIGRLNFVKLLIDWGNRYE